MKKYGFYCRMYGKDCFFETTYTNRTKRLAEEFINKVQNRLNTFTNITEGDIARVQDAMRRASFDIKTIKNGQFAGMSYYEIEGEYFNYGCDACENPMDKCIIVI